MSSPNMRLVRCAAGALFAAGCLGRISDPMGGGSSGSDQLSATQVAAPQIARLTNTAYINTLADLFPGVTLPTPDLPADAVVGDFDNDALGQSPNAAVLGQYQLNAVAVAAAVGADLATVLGCATVDQTCAQTWVPTFARRAYRRPLTSDESSRLLALFNTTVTASDVPTAVGVVIQAVLQAPAFLYRPEIGTPASGVSGLALLGPYEVASRLSYFLWNSMPDAALMAAADDGTVTDPATLETQARRLLADPRAHAAIALFHNQWLELSTTQGLTKDTTMFPLWSDAVASALPDATTQYVDKVFWDLGTLQALLTDNHAFVNDALAPIYGVPSPGATLTWTEVDATQRSGILTQAGLMAGFAHPTADSPVFRGVFVLDRFICKPPGAPPAGVNTSLPPPDTTGKETSRQEITQDHESGTCATCHKLIDGIGFGFEHYDALGAWRTTDNTLPIDSTGVINGTGDQDGPFDGAIELGKRLSESEHVQGCVASKWVQYALGLDNSALTSDIVTPTTKGLDTSAFDLRELVVNVVKSPTFRYRPLVSQ